MKLLFALIILALIISFTTAIQYKSFVRMSIPSAFTDMRCSDQDTARVSRCCTGSKWVDYKCKDGRFVAGEDSWHFTGDGQ